MNREVIKYVPAIRRCTQDTTIFLPFAMPRRAGRRRRLGRRVVHHAATKCCTTGSGRVWAFAPPAVRVASVKFN